MISEYDYAPTLGFVPELSLPDNLPELGHFATFENDASVDWTKQQMTPIAPSYNISMLPDLNDLLSSTSTNFAAPVPAPTTTTAPPPPPLPPADLPAIIPLTTAAPPPPPPPAPSLAPPPPPPPPSALDGPAPITSSNENDDDDENPLLAQIRKFSKNKLKTITTTSDPVDAAPLPPAAEQMDIMEALKQRLMKRRGFITGENADSTATSSKNTSNARAPSPPPQTGGAFTDAIASKAKEIAEEQQRRKDEDDDSDSDGDDWED